MKKLLLYSSFCLIYLLLVSCQTDDNDGSPLEGDWALVSVEATGTKVNNQRGVTVTRDAGWRMLSQNAILSFSGESLELSGPYELELMATENGRPENFIQSLGGAESPRSFDLLDSRITLGQPIFDFDYDGVDMDRYLVPVDIRFNVNGNELVLTRSQSTTVTLSPGVSVSETLNVVSVWRRP